MSTPFEGFNYMSLSGSLLTEPDLEANLTYNSDGYTIQFKGLYNHSPTAENNDNNNRTYDYDYTMYDYENARNATVENQEPTQYMETLILEGIVNDKKISTEFSVGTVSGPISFSLNTSIVIETSFDFLQHAKLFTAYEEEYQDGQFNQQFEGSAEYNEFEVRFYHHFAYLSINYFEKPVVDHNTFSSVLINFICVFFFHF